MMLLGLSWNPARSDETVVIGGTNAVLLGPDASDASIILMAGATGASARRRMAPSRI